MKPPETFTNSEGIMLFRYLLPWNVTTSSRRSTHAQNKKDKYGRVYKLMEAG